MENTKKRVLTLSEEEIWLITNALSFTYNKKLSVGLDNRDTLPDVAINEIFRDANRYDTLSGEIFNGKKG